MRGNARAHASRQGSSESDSLQKRIVTKDILEPRRTRRKNKSEELQLGNKGEVTVREPGSSTFAAIHAERVLRRATHVGYSRGYLCPWLSVCLYTDSLPGRSRETRTNLFFSASSLFPSAPFASTPFAVTASALQYCRSAASARAWRHRARPAPCPEIRDEAPHAGCAPPRSPRSTHDARGAHRPRIPSQ